MPVVLELCKILGGFFAAIVSLPSALRRGVTAVAQRAVGFGRRPLYFLPPKEKAPCWRARGSYGCSPNSTLRRKRGYPLKL
jgi:hypothetical protein